MLHLFAAAGLPCDTPRYDTNMCSIEVPELADLEGLGARQLERTLREVDTIRRRVKRCLPRSSASPNARWPTREDGHASVSGWVKATCNSSAW